MSRTPFGQWLREQAHRQDPVGDLARDFTDGGSKAWTKDGVVRDMRRHGACGGAWDALDAAVEEWDKL